MSKKITDFQECEKFWQEEKYPEYIFFKKCGRPLVRRNSFAMKIDLLKKVIEYVKTQKKN